MDVQARFLSCNENIYKLKNVSIKYIKIRTVLSNITITINTTYVTGYLRTLLIITLYTVLNSTIIRK